MCSDHFNPWSHRQGQSGFAWSWLGAALQAAPLSCGVVNAPGQRYHPAIIAQAIATLVEMFPGRFWTERGPVWHRYSGDQFGEHDDGRPFSTTDKGRGRAWPLLIGERAHYELLRGDVERAKELCRVMARYATETGLISEQVWDADDVPKRHLFRGTPTGSVCPLLWAHGEYIKLRRSLRDGRVFDAPPQTFKRYLAG